MNSYSPSNSMPTAYAWAWFIIPLLVVALFTYLARNLHVDDALIYLRYIRNFHEGAGLTYNVGERFNGLTSPFYALLVLLSSFVLTPMAATIVLSGIFLAATVLISSRLLSHSPREALFTAIITASIGYFYSTFGMETSVYLFLIAASLALYKSGSPYFLITLALVAITRTEGVFLGLVLGGDYLLRNRRLPDLRYVAVAAAIFLLPYLFNFLYYGEFLAATGSAKVAQGQSGLWGTDWLFFQIGYFRHAFFGGSYAPALIFAALACCGVFPLRRDRIARCILAFLLILLIFYTALNIPNYHWYYGPFFLFIVLFACHGFWWLSNLLLGFGIVSWRGALFVGLLAVSLFALSRMVNFEERGRDEAYVAVGEWLRDNTAEDATVAMVEIGVVGWYSERKVIDILGLVNEYNANYIGRREFMNWFLHYQPDYILRHEPAWPHEQSVKPMEDRGIYTQEAQFPGLVLLKRAPEHTPQDVVAAASEVIARRQALRDMARNGTSGVQLEEGSLFAHAPSEVMLQLDAPIIALEVAYGIRTRVEGLHSDICFEIRRSTDDTSLLADCITSQTPAADMLRHATIPIQGEPGEVLQFSIECPVDCDYAWSYWGDVYPVQRP